MSKIEEKFSISMASDEMRIIEYNDAGAASYLSIRIDNPLAGECLGESGSMFISLNDAKRLGEYLTSWAARQSKQKD